MKLLPHLVPLLQTILIVGLSVYVISAWEDRDTREMKAAESAARAEWAQAYWLKRQTQWMEEPTDDQDSNLGYDPCCMCCDE